ncbi:MAG: helix-turn-helix domain-containing protein, partial [Candidatus Lokiarchaeota archaeon]|nr:helix-turn-helix domain-containing protein [Candidatus Lokiarchaeota archaeon]
MKLNRAIKIRLYPNQAQEKMLNKTFGCCRFIYNKMLEERI